MLVSCHAELTYVSQSPIQIRYFVFFLTKMLCSKTKGRVIFLTTVYNICKVYLCVTVYLSLLMQYIKSIENGEHFWSDDQKFIYLSPAQVRSVKVLPDMVPPVQSVRGIGKCRHPSPAGDKLIYRARYVGVFQTTAACPCRQNTWASLHCVLLLVDD